MVLELKVMLLNMQMETCNFRDHERNMTHPHQLILLYTQYAKVI
jgi:hypothetical protein